MPDSKEIYNWSFEDTKNRSPVWYIIAISVVVGLAIWGFLSKQYGMSFVVLLVAWVAFFVENNAEEHITVSLTQLGLKVWGKFYDYSRINSYTFIYSWENAILIRLALSQRGIKTIDLKVNNTITEELKSILPNYIQENPKQDMSFVDRMIHLLKL